MSLENIRPKEVFKWFEEISKIPRESGDEKAISDFLVKFAKERNLEVYQDEALNVIIKKEATKGYEKYPTIILQGHMDMVCEKSAEHDFKKDPIKLIVEGDYLKADKTTLGADDGIAIAYFLAILDSKLIEHPSIEVLCTASEETDMNGVSSLNSEHLLGNIVLNIDGEEEGIFLVSCAGGVSPVAEFEIEKEPLEGSSVKISISGLKGGHSGVEIDKQRANAIKLLGRILYNVKDICIITHICGGSKDNAIAKYAEATVASINIEKVKSIIAYTYKEIKEEYRAEDPNIKICFENVENEKYMLKRCISKDIIDFMTMIPYGVEYMSRDIKGLVQTSVNVGILEEENERVVFTLSIRSSLESSLNEILFKIETMAKRTNARLKRTREYPPWQYEPDSKIRSIAVNTYKELTGKEPIITSVHAGLECGFLKKLIPSADIISFGPNIYDAHTPEESLSISSVERMWEFLKKLLINIK